MSDVLHLLEVVLNQPRMRRRTTRDSQADELRAERKIGRTCDAAMLAGQPIRAEARRHEAIDQLLALWHQREIAAAAPDCARLHTREEPASIALAKIRHGLELVPVPLLAGGGLTPLLVEP